MTEVTIPLDLFQSAAGYLLPRAAYDPEAQGIYNGLVVAFAKAQAVEQDGDGEAGEAAGPQED